MHAHVVSVQQHLGDTVMASAPAGSCCRLVSLLRIAQWSIQRAHRYPSIVPNAAWLAECSPVTVSSRGTEQSPEPDAAAKPVMRVVQRMQEEAEGASGGHDPVWSDRRALRRELQGMTHVRTNWG